MRIINLSRVVHTLMVLKDAGTQLLQQKRTWNWEISWTPKSNLNWWNITRLIKTDMLLNPGQEGRKRTTSQHGE